MLKNLLFAAQTIGPAERIEGARNYLGRDTLSTGDITTLAVGACIAVGFVSFIIYSYIKQKLKKK